MGRPTLRTILFGRGPRTLAEIREQATGEVAILNHEPAGVFRVIATVNDTRTEYRLEGDPGDPDAVVTEWAPTRFLA